jgi:hypothetical protein
LNEDLVRPDYFAGKNTFMALDCQFFCFHQLVITWIICHGVVFSINNAGKHPLNRLRRAVSLDQRRVAVAEPVVLRRLNSSQEDEEDGSFEARVDVLLDRVAQLGAAAKSRRHLPRGEQGQQVSYSNVKYT